VTIAPKRRRPRVWDDAQVIAWIVHRTGRAVNDAGGMLKAIQAEGERIDAKEAKPRKASLAFQLAIRFENDNPYSADGMSAAGRVVKRYAKAEKEFKAAIAAGRLKRKDAIAGGQLKRKDAIAGRQLKRKDAIAGRQLKRKDDRRLFNDEEVKAIWPGSGRGNSKKRFFNRVLVDRAAAVIARGPGGQTRPEVFRELGQKGFSKKEKQSALLRAAIDRAIHYLKSGESPSTEPSIEFGHPPLGELLAMPSVEGHPLVTSPSEAKELLRRHDVPDSARNSLEQLARTKQLLPRERKAQIQHVKAFKKRTLRGLITASN